VEYVLALRDAGFLDRVLLSHDVCLRSQLAIADGPGFTLIWRDFIPRLRDRGMSDDEIDLLVVANPRRALTGGG
jgi:phosphotriesterase-related protein